MKDDLSNLDDWDRVLLKSLKESEEDYDDEDDGDSYIKNEIDKQIALDRDQEEKYLFFISANSVRFARDAMQGDILGKYKNEVQKMLSLYERTGETMPKSKQLELELPDKACTKYEIEEAYCKLVEYNKRSRQVKLLSCINDSSDIEAAVQKIFNQYRINFGGEEKRLVIRSHADARAAIKGKLEKADTYIKSGYESINAIIGGGYRPGSIYLFVGLPGHAKSVWLCNIARDSIQQGRNILYLTTEMFQEDIFGRVWQSLYNTNKIENILSSNNNPEIGIFDVVKIPPKDWSPLNIDALIEKSYDKPDLIIIDYADEILSDKDSRNTYEEQGDVYAGLRRLAEKYNLPIITATQSNRSAADDNGGTKEVFGQAAVADSARKTQQVDVLMSIILTQRDRDEKKIRLFFAKNRHGISGKMLTYKCDFETMRIDDTPLKTEIAVFSEEEQEEYIQKEISKRRIG